MDIFLIIACAILLISTVSDAILAIRNFIYQKKWDNEKDRVIREEPDITIAELCLKYVDFCAENRCSVDY